MCCVSWAASRAGAAAYWGFRTWCRGGEHRTEFVTQTTRQGLLTMKQVTKQIRDYPVKPPSGQWDWVSDADAADRYWQWIVEEGRPDDTWGHDNGMGGKTIPIEVE